MFRKPWTNGACAYVEVDTIKDAIQGFKRARLLQMFIITDKGVMNKKFTCAVCQKPVTVKTGNRCDYYPREKKVLIMHYACAWSNLLHEIYGSLYDRLINC